MSRPDSVPCAMSAAVQADRLALLDLDCPVAAGSLALLQSQVIRPNVDRIVDGFCEWLAPIELFAQIILQHSSLETLQQTLRRYLLGLGVDFAERRYFDERLRVGRVHQQLGVPQYLYQCAFRQLQQLLIEAIPDDLREDAVMHAHLVDLIIRITALDMSLATESYCNARLSSLQHSLENERGESARLRKLSHTDWLTGLHNHSSARQCLQQALETAIRRARPLSVLMADLDHFKTVNDTHGHLVGDEVLRIAASRMLTAARSGDELGRYGGEEFLFILQDTGLDDAEEVAERVRTHVQADAIHCGGRSIRISLSIGAAQACADDSVNSLLERADASLYEAKTAGRNCVRVAR